MAKGPGYAAENKQVLCRDGIEGTPQAGRKMASLDPQNTRFQGQVMRTRTTLVCSPLASDDSVTTPPPLPRGKSWKLEVGT